jgi:hypothetical protein
MKIAAIGALLALASLSLPAMAATEKYQVKGQSANAGFYQVADECTSTSVYVSAFDNLTKDAPGAPTAQKQAYLDYYSFNACTGQSTYGYGTSSDATFKPNTQLSSATLTGTFTLTEYPFGTEDPQGTTKTAQVSLTWTGTGDTYRGNSHSHYQGPGFISNSRYTGTYRDAQVSGTVLLDGKNLISGLESYGSLNSSNSGYLQITRRGN